MLRCFPGLKQNAVFQVFIRGTASVETLRDVIQHLNNELRDIGEKQSSALGTITWLGPSVEEHSSPTAWILQPGSFYPGQITHGPMMDIEARVSPGEISQIHLVTSGVRVDLPDVIKRIRTMIASIEPSMREHCTGRELMGSDVVMHFSMIPVSETGAMPLHSGNEG